MSLAIGFGVGVGVDLRWPIVGVGVELIFPTMIPKSAPQLLQRISTTS
jgi:hypothetical protein